MLHWTVHLTGGHCHPLRGAAVVVDGRKVYYFGRSSKENSNSDLIEVLIFNTVSLRWRILPPETTTGGGGERPLEGAVARRSGQAQWPAVLIEDTVYLWGGHHLCNVLYAFVVDDHSWSKPGVTGTVPEPKQYHTACVLEKIMYVYGGWTQGNTQGTNDMYKLDTTTMVWSLINTKGTPPPASWGHSATVIGTKMFVFGGWSGSVYLNTIRVFDTETNVWLSSTPSAQILPGRRSGHSAFAYHGELYIFGGRIPNDLWKFNPETFSWSQVEPKGKSPTTPVWMCCCHMGDLIVLFGGYDRSDELFILDFSPSLKMLCKLSVVQYALEQSELPHDIKWELAAMATNN